MPDLGSQNDDKRIKPKKKKLGIRIIIFLLLVVIGLSTALWWLVKSTRQQQDWFNKYSREVEILKQEKERCSTLLGQEEGSFSEYEYCQQLLQKFP